MGWRYRKSIGLGNGFRINISKSGIGYSWGTRGFRITKTSTGRIRKTYSLYGTGISYVEESGCRKNKPQNITSADPVYEMLSADIKNFRTAEHIDIINKIANILRLDAICNVLLWFAVMGILNYTFFILPAIGLTGKIFLRILGAINLEYDFDDESKWKYNKCVDALIRLKKCHKVWQITANRINLNKKAHSGAGISSFKEIVKIKNKAPFYIKSDIPVISIKLKKETLIFLPDKLIVSRKTKVGAISYPDISIQVNCEKFIENGKIPKDSTVAGYVWKYANKNGGPDRRYSNNYQRPVCKYGVIRIQSTQGLNVELVCSDYQAASVFKDGYSSRIV